jgi:hypothetical protein
MVQKLEDKPPYIKYEMREIEDRAATIANGQYTAKDILFVVVTPAGSKDELDFEAEAWLARQRDAVRAGRLPQKWLDYYLAVKKAHEEGLEEPTNGTPLSRWPGLSPAQHKNFLSCNIRTVEDVASMNEEALMRVGMGARSLQQRAQAYLDALKSGVGQASEANAALKVENASLAQQVKDLNEQVHQLKQLMQTATSLNLPQMASTPPPTERITANDLLGN